MISITGKAYFIIAVRVLRYLKHLPNTALWRPAEWVLSYWLTHTHFHQSGGLPSIFRFDWHCEITFQKGLTHLPKVCSVLRMKQPASMPSIHRDSHLVQPLCDLNLPLFPWHNPHADRLLPVVGPRHESARDIGPEPALGWGRWSNIF